MSTELTIKEQVQKMRDYYETGATQSYEFRLNALKSFRRALKKYEEEFVKAHIVDYNKCEFEAYLYELLCTYADIDEAIKSLKKWMKPQTYTVPLGVMPAKGVRYRDPFGVVLIVSPFNFVGNLTFIPMVGAIAGGNCMAITPSNYTPTVSAVVKKIVNEAFPPEYAQVFLGGHDVKSALFDCYFDFSMYTGGTVVSKLLVKAQAEHATTVLTELGGKSPCYVHKDCDLTETCNGINWAKWANGGMICVNVDYILVDEEIHDKFLKALIENIKKYQYDAQGNLRSNFVRQPSIKQFNQVMAHYDEDKVVFGGKYDESKLLIEPTILDNVELTDKCMQSEIFGPILPIITVKNKEEAVETIHKVGHIYNAPDGAKPLAFYVYTKDKKVADYMLAHVQSGGACVNSSIFHFLGQPFNGTQFSGSGDGYHGHKSFIVFTHGRTVTRYERLTPVHKAMQWLFWQRPLSDRIIDTVCFKWKLPIDRLAYFALHSHNATEVD